jgi:hypothetical protein
MPIPYVLKWNRTATAKNWAATASPIAPITRHGTTRVRSGSSTAVNSRAASRTGSELALAPDEATMSSPDSTHTPRPMSGTRLLSARPASSATGAIRAISSTQL